MKHITDEGEGTIAKSLGKPKFVTLDDEIIISRFKRKESMTFDNFIQWIIIQPIYHPIL